MAIKLKVMKGLYNGVTTAELDSLAADVAAAMSTNHADYAILAARIVVSNLHKETKKQFSGLFPTFSSFVHISEISSHFLRCYA